jgi:hypothetical protein
MGRNYLPTGACCRVGKDGEKPAPARIRNGLGEVVVLHQVGDLQLVVIDRVELAPQLERRLMLEVLALALPLQVYFRQHLDRLATAVAPLLAAGYTAVRRFEATLGTAIAARGLCSIAPSESVAKGF